MTLDELNRLLQAIWMSVPEEERFLTGGRLYEAEKAILERLAPAEYSHGERREFVFYHMHGIQMPGEAIRQFESRGQNSSND